MKSNRKLNAILLAGIFLIATHAHAQSRQNIIGAQPVIEK
jgi:hypothetical protein